FAIFMLHFYIFFFFFFFLFFFFFSSRRRHTRFDCDWSSDVCSSDLRISSTQQHHRRSNIIDAATLSTQQHQALRDRLRKIEEARSEERRVGKECRSRRSTDQ